MNLNYIKISNKLVKQLHFNNILAKNNSTKYVTFLNPYSFNVFLEHEEYINTFDMFFADGKLLVMLHNLFHLNKINRVSFDFSSIAHDVLSYANNNRVNVAFIGAKEKELNLALLNIKKMYPNIHIAYSRNGYFESNIDFIECVKNIKDSNIDILIVGMGSPYQEEFVVKIQKEKIKSLSLVITCGGFLTQTSIKADYYHPIIKKTGLRWLQRAFMHKHVRDRLMKDYPKFVIKYIYHHIFSKHKY